MIIKADIEQGSRAWHELHGSVPSASRFREIITTKGEPSKSRYGYMYELAATRVWGVSKEEFQSWDMRRGIELEPEARKAYELITGETVEQVGFCYYDDRLDRGMSPDGILFGEIPWETKCPRLKRHTQYFTDDRIKDDYFQQRQGQIYIARSGHGVFCSYFPGAPLFMAKVHRDDKFIDKLDKALDEFNQELHYMCDKLKSKI